METVGYSDVERSGDAEMTLSLYSLVSSKHIALIHIDASYALHSYQTYMAANGVTSDHKVTLLNTQGIHF